MRDELRERLRELGQEFLEENDADEYSYSRQELGQFLQELAESKESWSADFEKNMDSMDDLNDTVVPVLRGLFERSKFCEGFETIVYLFDENVRFDEPTEYEGYKTCGDLVLYAICSGISKEDFKEILDESADQEEFVIGVVKKMDSMQKKQEEPDSAPKKKFSSVNHIEQQFIDCLNQQISELKQQLKETRDEVSSKNKELESLRDSLKEQESVLHTHKADFEKQAVELEQVRSELSKEKMNGFIWEKKYQNAKSNFDSEAKLNIKLSADFKQEKEMLTEKIMALESVIPDEKDQQENFEREKERLSEEIVALREKNNEYSDSIQRMQEDNERLQQENNHLQEENDAFREENGRFRTEIGELNEELNDYRNKVSLSEKKSVPVARGAHEESGYVSMSELNELPQEKENTSFTADFTAKIMEKQEELEEDEDSLLPIHREESAVKKISNLFSRLLSESLEKKFLNKPQADQENLIFMKMMNGDYPEDVCDMISTLLDGNRSFSRMDLYRLLSKRADESEIKRFCQNVA